ncbi:hypothetical protein G3M55_39565, partial [Streptomyces sp. SID8455]|nr:hypothetical protein [Streptomyces sp. SID8455]
AEPLSATPDAMLLVCPSSVDTDTDTGAGTVAGEPGDAPARDADPEVVHTVVSGVLDRLQAHLADDSTAR